MNTLELETGNGIARVYMNRPDKRNALNPELLQELYYTFSALGKMPEIKVIILEGRGKAFCAGADLSYLEQVSQFSIIENFYDSSHLQRTFHTIYTCPKPVIARVHGPAIAGGCGLATVCDFVIAGQKAVFGYSEVKIGFIPAIVMVYLLKKIGDTRTRDLLLSAKTIPAAQAESLGLITRAVPDEELDIHVDQLAQDLCANSSSSMALTKEMLNNLHGMSLDAGLRYAASMNAFTRMTDDCRTGIAAFLQK
jgi:methylglutaconyl-CoA hydratase